MARVRYEIDPHNRLVARETGEESQVASFREVLDGTFKIGDGNSLVYHIKKSEGKDIPQQVKFSGNWSLDNEHNLIFMLDKWNNQVEGNELILKGALIDASGSELVYSITTRDTSENERIYILKFSGRWQADKDGRLCFNIEKESGSQDVLVLKGIWKVNETNEIVYTHRQTDVITFKGYWDISKGNRLSYILNKDLGSRFDFRVSLQKATKDGFYFSLGIGATPTEKQLVLYGTWKLDQSKRLVFEVHTDSGEFSRLELGLHYAIPKSDGEAFIKALVSKKEVFVGAGAGFRF